MTTKTKAILGVGLVAGLGVALMPLVSYADTDSGDAYVQVNVAESITITEIDNTAMNLSFSGGDISNAVVRTGSHAVTVSTSATNGWSLAMAADTATLNLRTGTAPNVYGGASGFSGIGGTATDANLAAAINYATLGTGQTFAPSTAPPATGAWGFRMAGWTADNFVSVPTADIIIAAANAAGTQEVTVTFGAQAGTTTPTGYYGTWITYTAATQ